MRAGRHSTRAGALGAALLLAAGCGAKSPLQVEETDAAVRMDAGTDAGVDAGSDAGTDAGRDAGLVCVPGVVRLEASTVEVVFVIDRSGSMLADFEGLPPGTDPSRWELLETSMRDALSVFDDRIGVGAKFFPSRSARAEPDDCAVYDGLDVPVGPGRADGVLTQFARWNPSGGTPLGPATREALDALLARSGDDRAQFIVVATDGAPTCAPDAYGQALEVIREAHEDHGIDVYVLGIASTEPEVERLDVLAVEGGRPRPLEEGRRFYDARDPLLLDALLEEIARDLAQCVYTVPLPPEEDAEVEVMVDGAVVPRDEAREEGWDWTSERRQQLSLFGTACERAIASGGRVRATITCR